MNKIYKIVWNKVRNCYVVASEFAKGHTRGTSDTRSALRRRLKAVAGQVVVAGVLAMSLAALPMGSAFSASSKVDPPKVIPDSGYSATGQPQGNLKGLVASDNNILFAPGGSMGLQIKLAANIAVDSIKTDKIIKSDGSELDLSKLIQGVRFDGTTGTFYYTDSSNKEHSYAKVHDYNIYSAQFDASTNTITLNNVDAYENNAEHKKIEIKGIASAADVTNLDNFAVKYDKNTDGSVNKNSVTLGNPNEPGGNKYNSTTHEGGTTITNVSYATGRDGSAAVNVDYLNDQIANSGWWVQSGDSESLEVKNGEEVKFSGENGLVVSQKPGANADGDPAGAEISVKLGNTITIGETGVKIGVQTGGGANQSDGNYITGLTNTKWESGNIVADRAATEGQLQEVAQNAANVNLSNITNDGRSVITNIAKEADVHVKDGEYSVQNDGSVTMTYVDGNGKDIADKTLKLTGIAKNDLSNITNDGKKVITGLASVVEAGENVTVSDTVDATTGKHTYTVKANDTTLKAGKAGKETAADGSYTYTIEDTAGNKVILDDIASGKKLTEIDGRVTNNTNEITIIKNTAVTGGRIYSNGKIELSTMNGSKVEMEGTLQDYSVTSGTYDKENKKLTLTKTDAYGKTTEDVKIDLSGIQSGDKNWIAQANGTDVKPNAENKVNFINGDNTNVTTSGDGVIAVNLNKELKGLNSVTTNNAYVTNVDASKNESVTNVEYVKNQIADAALSAGEGISITDKKINVKLKDGEQNLVVNQDGLSLKNDIRLAADVDNYVDISGSKGKIWASGSVAAGNVVMDGTTATISGLSNKTIDASDFANGKGKAATEEQLKIVNDTANAGWNVSTNGGTATNVAPGATVDFSGTDDNIKVTNDGTKVKVALNKELTGQTSVTTNNAYVTNVDASKNESVTNVEYVNKQIANSGWHLKAGEGAASAIKNGHTVEFVGANGLKVDKNETDDTTTVTVDFDKKITVGGTVIGVQAGGGANPDEGNYITGLTNTKWDASKIESGRAATEDQLKEVQNSINTDISNKTFGLADDNGNKLTEKLDNTIQVKGEDGITSTVKDGALVIGLSNNLSIGKDGKDGHIGVNGADGKSGVAIDGKDGISIKGKDGKDAVSIYGKDGVDGVNGAEGHIGLNGKDGKTDIWTAPGKPGLDGADGTTMTRVIYENNGVKHEVATLDDGLKFKGDSGDTIGKKLNETLTIKGNAATGAEFVDGNIGVVGEGGNLVVKLNKDLTGLNSVTTNNAYVTEVKEGDKTSVTNVEYVNKQIANSGWNLAVGTDPATAIKKDSTVTFEAADGVTVKKEDVTDADGVTGAKVTVGLGNQITVGGTVIGVQNGGGANTGNGNYITGLENKEWNKDSIASGRAATEDQLQKVQNAINTDISNKTFGLADDNGNKLTEKLDKTIQVKGADGITSTVKDGALEIGLSNNLSIGGKDGKPGQVGVKGSDGKDAVSIYGKDGVNGVNGSEGHIGLNGKNGTTDIWTGPGRAGLDGADGTTMTRVLYKDPDGNDHEVATLDDGLKFKGDRGETIAKKLNETLTIKGNAAADAELSDGNIGVVNENGSLIVKLNKNVTGLNSVTMNNAYVTNVDASKGDSVTNVDYVKKQIDSVTLTGGNGISITDNKINVKLKEGEKNLKVDETGLYLRKDLVDMESITGVGGKISFATGGNVNINNIIFNNDGRIQNVTAGTELTDAVNVGQMENYVAAKDTHIKGGDYAVGEVTDSAGKTSQGVSMDIVDGKGNTTGKVIITDIAKASDVGDVNKFKGTDLENKDGSHTTVVDAVTNLNNKVGDLNYVEGGAGTKGNYVTNGENTTTSIGKLDKALKDVADTAAKHTTVEGSSNIKVNNTAKPGEAANYKIELSENIKVNSVTATKANIGGVSIENNLVDNLSNKSWDAKNTEQYKDSGKAATEAQLQQAMSGTVQYDRKDDGTVNKTQITLNKEGDTYTTITNVANGKVEKDSKDAINGGQLFETENKINNRIDGVENQVISNSNRIGQLSSRVNKVGAGAAALAALHPMDFDPDDKWSFAAGYGNYAGENAAAIGAYYRPDEKVMFSVGGTVGNGENMVNAGISFALDRTNHVSNSRTALAREVIDLRGQLAEMGAKMAKMEKAFGMLDETKTKLFPDIPANHWAYEYIAKLAGNGYIEGYPDGNFGGDRLMTRYEFAAMLYRAIENGAAMEEKIIKEFEPELGRIRVDRISGEDGDRDKIERVRVNDTKGERDHYGNKLAK